MSLDTDIRKACKEGKNTLESLFNKSLSGDAVIEGEFYVLPRKGKEDILENYFCGMKYKAERTERKLGEKKIEVFKITRINLKELDELLDKPEVKGFLHYSKTWDEVGRSLSSHKRGDWKRIRDARIYSQKEGLFAD